jgi:hypothetical protein
MKLTFVLILFGLAITLTLVILFILFCIGRAKKQSYSWKIALVERAVRMLPLTEANFWEITSSFQELRRIDRDPDRTEKACSDFFEKYKPFWNNITNKK